MKTLFALAIGIVLGWSLTVGAEILDQYGNPMQPPGHWAPMTQSQQQQLNWSLQNNLNQFLQQQNNRPPC